MTCDPRSATNHNNMLTKTESKYFIIFIFFDELTDRNNKFGADDTTSSRDSDSLIQEYINVPQSDLYSHCWNHPKIQENWRTVLAAVTLLIIGKSYILLEPSVRIK